MTNVRYIAGVTTTVPVLQEQTKKLYSEIANLQRSLQSVAARAAQPLQKQASEAGIQLVHVQNAAIPQTQHMMGLLGRYASWVGDEHAHTHACNIVRVQVPSRRPSGRTVSSTGYVCCQHNYNTVWDRWEI